MSEQNKAVIRWLSDEVWNRRAFDVADELFAPKAVIYESGVALPGAGPAVVKEGIWSDLRGLSGHPHHHR